MLEKKRNIVLAMEDYFSTWVVFHAKDASSGKIILNGYLLPPFLLLYRLSWARIIRNATTEEIALQLYDLCLGLAFKCPTQSRLITENSLLAML